MGLFCGLVQSKSRWNPVGCSVLSLVASMQVRDLLTKLCTTSTGQWTFFCCNDWVMVILVNLPGHLLADVQVVACWGSWRKLASGYDNAECLVAF
ncbi:unnamed protein product [Rhodiola kirilowii]